MAAISRGQENNTGLINWFITVNGTLTDAFLIEYRILDITAGLPGTQIFPVTATPPTYEDVTASPGKFSTGSYFAFDNGAGTGWTPDLAEPVGTHRIEWRWKISAAAPFQSGCEDFEVLVQSAGSSADLYCSVQDIRDEGLADPPFTDAQILASIELWQQFLERATRQWFVPRILVIKFDGTDSDALHLGVPIISVDYLRLNDDTNNLDTALFRVYNARRYPDDRRNPRIKLRSENELDIFTAPVTHHGRRLKFRKGRQNQEIKGTFGFTEEDGSTPALIKRALCKLVIEKLTNPPYFPGGTPGVGPTPPPALTGGLLEEWTDGHKLQSAQAGGALKPRAAGMTGITNDQEILDVIRLYKAPIGIATPAHPSHSGTL